MASIFSNRDVNSFFLSKNFNHDPQLSPPAPRSAQHRQCCLADAAASGTVKRPWDKEHTLLTIDSRHHGTIKSTSLDIAHNSGGNSRSNKAQHERKGLLRSPMSSCAQAIDISTLPPAIARDAHRKIGWLKARLQHERDRKRGRVYNSEMDKLCVEAEKRTVSRTIGPERKQIAFFKEENRKYSREDRAGTPHNSELQGDDDLIAPFSVQELGMGGEADALATS